MLQLHPLVEYAIGVFSPLGLKRVVYKLFNVLVSKANFLQCEADAISTTPMLKCPLCINVAFPAATSFVVAFRWLGRWGSQNASVPQQRKEDRTRFSTIRSIPYSIRVYKEIFATTWAWLAHIKCFYCLLVGTCRWAFEPLDLMLRCCGGFGIVIRRKTSWSDFCLTWRY